MIPEWSPDVDLTDSADGGERSGINWKKSSVISIWLQSSLALFCFRTQIRSCGSRETSRSQIPQPPQGPVCNDYAVVLAMTEVNWKAFFSHSRILSDHNPEDGESLRLIILLLKYSLMAQYGKRSWKTILRISLIWPWSAPTHLKQRVVQLAQYFTDQEPVYTSTINVMTTIVNYHNHAADSHAVSCLSITGKSTEILPAEL